MAVLKAALGFDNELPFTREGFVLKRVSAMERTVRYEWPGLNDDPATYYSPAFHATLQEWERAVD